MLYSAVCGKINKAPPTYPFELIGPGANMLVWSPFRYLFDACSALKPLWVSLNSLSVGSTIEGGGPSHPSLVESN